MNQFTSNLTKKDIINAQSGVSVSMYRNAGAQLTVTGAAVLESTDEHGEIKTCSYLFTEDGTIYAGNSVVTAKIMPDIVDYLEDEISDGNPSIQVKIVKGTTKSGDKDIISLQIV